MEDEFDVNAWWEALSGESFHQTRVGKVRPGLYRVEIGEAERLDAEADCLFPDPKERRDDE